jgi:Uma2 family endonuclease
MSREPETILIPEVVLDFSALDRLPTDQDLPCSDGEPLETIWHRFAMLLLIDSLSSHWKGRTDFFVGGDMFYYFSEDRVFNKDFRGPDFFVVKGADRFKRRDSWVYWKEKGRHANVIIELSSPSTAHVDLGEKKTVYCEQLRVPEYYVYDPRDESLVGWMLVNGVYEPIELQEGNRLWSRQLDLYIGPADGEYMDVDDRWLRFFDKRGRLIRTSTEASREETAAAEKKAKAAEAELARVKRELAALKKKRKK